MKTLSVVMITKNEEGYVERALQSVKDLAHDIIVVDSGSTDATVARASAIGATIVSSPWRGYGATKNLARDHATGEWILHIDADEEVSPALAEEIRRTLEAPTHDYYWLPIITEFLGRPLTHAKGMNLRLFRKDAAQWDDREVHEQLERTHARSNGSALIRLSDDDTGTLQTALLHHGHYQTLAAYYERQDRYTTADAQQMRKTGLDRSGRPVRVSRRNPFSVAWFLYGRAIKQFIRRFIKQRGILDGWRGWVWSYVSAQYEVRMCHKYLRLLAHQP